MKVKTYDLVNAGPRHRFMANGKIVSNCGKMFQPQNLPSRGLLPPKRVKAGIEALKGGYAEIIGYDTMRLTMSALRYAITAKPGHKLIVSDLSNIEGRALAYLAGEDWKLKAFEEFDNGIGQDLYKVAYAKSFNIRPEEVTKQQRDYVGKVLELSMGYGGGVGGLLVFLVGFGIDLDDLTQQVQPLIPDDVYEEAEKFYDWMNDMDVSAAKEKAKKAGRPMDWREFYERKSTYELSPKVFVALESLKRLWRRGHPATVKFWKDCDKALRSAVSEANKDFRFGKCYARRTGRWVRIVLPSGHNIVYPGMRVNDEGKIVFRGVNQFTKKWGDIETHGSRAVENCCQAFARDVFKYGQLNAIKKGYDLILPVHDELVTHVPDDGNYTLKELTQIMATVPPWAPGMPLAAAGFEDTRYHK